uniref:Uncharacterized protein n=1 Tax=Romanomermis culicivorax TaxID=13658 RepID=A0A915IPD0_ROMCU
MKIFITYNDERFKHAKLYKNFTEEYGYLKGQLKYAVYYTQDVTAPFEQWSKVLFEVQNLEGRIGNLEDAEWYAFCISSVYDRGHSPISRTVYPVGSVAAVVDDIVQL